MPVVDMILIALAGVAAGAINSLVGSGTLVTFPTLVALGYPPVVSTMSNAIGLVAGGISGTWGYRGNCAASGTGCAGRCLRPSSAPWWARGCFCTCPRRSSPKSCRCC